MTKVTLHLKTGEKIAGITNYTTATHVELRLSDGSFAWIAREDLA